MTDASQRRGGVMMQRDRASVALGMVLRRDEPGHAVMSMAIRDDSDERVADFRGRSRTTSFPLPDRARG